MGNDFRATYAYDDVRYFQFMPYCSDLKLRLQVDSEFYETKIGIACGRGMAFHQMVSSRGEWHYAGAGVKLGDAATAIFWYQPQGSDTYRVIYGDLSVKDVAEADLPK